MSSVTDSYHDANSGRFCAKCSYALRGCPSSGNCPECDSVYTPQTVLYHRKRWRVPWLILLMGLPMWTSLSAAAAMKVHMVYRKAVFWDTVATALFWTAVCSCVIGLFALPILGVWLVRKLERIPVGMTVVFILSCVTSVLGVALLVYLLRIALAFGAMPP